MLLRLSRYAIIFALLLAPLAGRAQAQSPVVRAVLLYSPTCSHCHTVMDETLPPLRARYGAQLEILEVNIQEPEGSAIYQRTLERYKPSVRGVPMLVIGEHVLVGSVQIPDRLPGLIEHFLEVGGVDWPALPHMPGAVESDPADPAPLPETAPAAAASGASDGALHLLYFQSPSCGGCRELEGALLAELQTRYGKQLHLIAINTSEAAGKTLYDLAAARYRPRLEGVPTIVVGKTMLAGNRDIAAQLPALLEEVAASGGAPLPELPGLEDYIAAANAAAFAAAPVEAATTSAPWPLIGIGALALIGAALAWVRLRR